MRVELDDYLGPEGFADRFTGRILDPEGARSCEVRWAPEADGDLKARVLDAGRLSALVPQAGLQPVLGFGRVQDGVAVVLAPSEGVRLDKLPGLPLPVPVVMALVAQLAEVIDALYSALDPASGQPLQVIHRCLSGEHVRLRRDGSIQLSGLDGVRFRWPGREAMTNALTARPGARLAPEHLLGVDSHEGDVFLLGLLAYELLRPVRKFPAPITRMLALEAPAFDQAWANRLGQVNLRLGPGELRLLEGMVRHDPGARPSAGEVARIARDLGAQDEDLAHFAAGCPQPPLPQGEWHLLCGERFDAEPATAGPTSDPSKQAEPEPVGERAPRTPSEPGRVGDARLLDVRSLRALAEDEEASCESAESVSPVPEDGPDLKPPFGRVPKLRDTSTLRREQQRDTRYTLVVVVLLGGLLAVVGWLLLPV